MGFNWSARFRFTTIWATSKHRVNYCGGDRGISLFGGRGSIAGSLLEAGVGVFSLGLRLLGTDVQWTYLLIGILIIAAVTVDQYIRQASRDG